MDHQAEDLAELRRLESEAAEYEGDFIKGGIALGEIRDRHLYLLDYPTFREYCKRRFNGQYSKYLEIVIKAARAALVLKSSGLTPDSADLIKTLHSLPEGKWMEAWFRARFKVGEKRMPTKKHVTEATDEIREEERCAQEDAREIREITKAVLGGRYGDSQQVGWTSGVAWMMKGQPKIFVPTPKEFNYIVGHSPSTTPKKWEYLVGILGVIIKSTIVHIQRLKLPLAHILYTEPFAGPVSYQLSQYPTFFGKFGSPWLAFEELNSLLSNEKDIQLWLSLSDEEMFYFLYHTLKAKVPEGCPHHINVYDRPCDYFIDFLVRRAEGSFMKERPTRQKLLEVWDNVFGAIFFDPTRLVYTHWKDVEKYVNCHYLHNIDLIFNFNTYREKAMHTNGNSELRWTEKLRLLNRQFVYIMEQAKGSSRFAIVVCSNFRRDEEFEKVGLYNVDLPIGGEYLRIAGYNIEERSKNE